MATEADVSAALAGIRRRARYLEEANRNWSGAEVASLVVGATTGLFLMWRGGWDVSMATVGFILFASVTGGWNQYRLKARIDALTKLVREIGYADEA